MVKDLATILDNLLIKDPRFALLRDWKKVVAPFDKCSRLECVDGDLLVIGVYDAHWMQELYLVSNELMGSVNNYFGKKVIKRVKFRLVGKVCRPENKKSR